jgi:hypothetical protein
MTMVNGVIDRVEAQRVQAMQVRTNAANIASVLLQHRQTSPKVWLARAQMIEQFILGHSAGNDPLSSI